MSASLISIRPTKTSKVQLEFVQKIVRNSQNVVGMLNKSDDRFKSETKTHAWVSGEPKDIEEKLPMLKPYLDKVQETGEAVSVPEIVIKTNDKEWNIQVVETHVVKDSQIPQLAKIAKRKSKDDPFYLHQDGKIILSNKTVVEGMPAHRFIQHNGEAPLEDLYAEYNDSVVSISALVMGAASEASSVLERSIAG